MKEFISKWSNWWVLNSKRKQLDEAFEKELNELVQREVALRMHDVIGRSETFVCGHPPKRTYLLNDTWHCEECGGKWKSIANK